MNVKSLETYSDTAKIQHLWSVAPIITNIFSVFHIAFLQLFIKNGLERGLGHLKKEDYCTWMCIWVSSRGNSVDLPDWFSWHPLLGPVHSMFSLLLLPGSGGFCRRDTFQ